MAFFRKSKMNSTEFMSLSEKLESFERSAKEMSEKLEQILKGLSESLVRNEERIKVESDRSMLITQQLANVGKETSILRLALASLLGGIAVLTFLAGEAGLVKALLKMQDTPPPVERVK